MQAAVARKFENIEDFPEVTAPSSTAPQHFEPIIIDLAKHRRKRSRSLRFPWMLVSLTPAFLAACASVFILGVQAQHMELTLATRPAMHAEAIPLAPLPPEAMGKMDILPILARLPVAQDLVPEKSAPPPRTADAEPDRMMVSIDQEPEQDKTQSQVDDLLNAGAQNASTGRPDEAMRLYEEALRLKPDDRAIAYNLVALILQKAASFDDHANWREATALYQRALGLWGESDELGTTIKARMEWVRQRQYGLQKAASAD